MTVQQTSSRGDRESGRGYGSRDQTAGAVHQPDRAGILPVLAVSLNRATMRLAWCAPRSKRWRGRCRSIEEVCHEADAAGVPAHCLLDYVER